jgi:parallel beta-helix repeat protein
MNRRLVLIMALTLLVGMLSVAFNVQRAKASGTIYIRADGSIDPPDAPISTVDNVTYTLIGNITSDSDGIVVERSNIIIDGAGYTVEGPMASYPISTGISLQSNVNVTIKNTNIENFYYGIKISSSSNNTISRNNITANNEDGIWLAYSSNNSISGNNITNNGKGIFLLGSSNNSIAENVFVSDGLAVSDSYGNIVVNNLVNGKSLTYLEDVSDAVVGDTGQVILVNCIRIRVENLNLSHTTVGVQLWRTSHTTIAGNNITANNEDGISLSESSNNNAVGNKITNNNYSGIALSYYSSNNSISGNSITNNGKGIYLDYSSNNSISGNNITNNMSGIKLAESSDNTLRNNHMSDNQYNFGVYGYELSHLINDVDSSNTVDGKLVCYWVNRHNEVTPADAGYVAVVNSTGITVSNLDLKNNERGILLAYTKNSTIAGNNITNNGIGIGLDSSSNNMISGNNITNNSDGMRLYDSPDSSISGNNITTNGNKGIVLDDSSNVSVSGNNITANHYEGITLGNSFNDSISGNNIIDNMNGIYLYNSFNDSIFDNNLMNNKCGVIIQSSNACTFYHNNFINNGMPPFFVEQVWSYGSVNVWDDGYPSGGNYWSDYDGTDANHDGFGDTPYVIDANNTDNYPLMVQYVIPEFPIFFILPLFMMATSLAVIVYTRKNKISDVM